MRKSLGIVAIVAGLLGLLGAGTELSSSDPNIMVSAFLVLCALLSIALGVAEWRNRHKTPYKYLRYCSPPELLEPSLEWH